MADSTSSPRAGSTTELIKEKLDIVEFLKGYLTLTPAGKNFKALCPFHHEKTPSFMVSPERQSWKCFGCNLGGDVFTFLMQYENLDFGEALRILAEKTGVELRRLNPAEYKFTGLLYDLNSAAKDFFRRELSVSDAAKKYLVERGLKSGTVNDFEIGWAPSDPEKLSLHLMKTGFKSDDIMRAGLAIKTDRGMQLDRFRGRIMFPIHNHTGRVVGFTGRVLPQLDTGQFGKYVNSPETPIFNKSKLLYGFWQSKNHIREAGSVFLVEGQMDFLMSYQAGVRNVAATSGTAMTLDHLRTLRRLTDNLILSFDSDEAGFTAFERAIDLAEANDFNVRVAIFEGYKDPAEAAQADPEGVHRVIENARHAMELYFEKYLPRRDRGTGGVFSDPRDRDFLRNLRIVLGRIKNIASPVLQSVWFKDLSRRTGVAEKVLWDEAEKIEVKSGIPAGAIGEETVSGGGSFSRFEHICQRLLSAAKAAGNMALLEESVPYLENPYPEIFELMKAGEKNSADPKIDDLMNLIMLRSEEVSEEELRELKDHLLKEYLVRKRQSLAEAVRRAEAMGDELALGAALEEFNRLPVI